MTPKNQSKKGRVILKRGKTATVINENVLSTKTLGNFILKISAAGEVVDIESHGLKHNLLPIF